MSAFFDHPVPLESTPNETVTLKLGPQGRLVIPASLRHRLELPTGVELVARAVDGQLIIEKIDNLRRRLAAPCSAS